MLFRSGVIDLVKNDKNIKIDDNNFYTIEKYRCSYGFNMEAYQKHQNEIGSIDNLKQQLTNRAKISFYMIVFLDDSLLDKVCDTIISFEVLPKFVSFITYRNNDTKKIIDTCNSKLNDKVGWKLHNMLNDLDYQESLDVVLDTNAHTKSSSYLWINYCDSLDSWSRDIKQINHTITLLQPECNALLRTKDHNDGLFIGLQNYDEIRHSVDPEIFKALKTLPNPVIKYYA